VMYGVSALFEGVDKGWRLGYNFALGRV